MNSTNSLSERIHQTVGQKTLRMPLIMLINRPMLFVFFQMLFALVLHSWTESIKYWMIVAILTNVVSILLLVFLFKQEGVLYLSLFRFHVKKQDLIVFLGIILCTLPAILIPSFALSSWLWGNATYYHRVLFQPIPTYLVYLAFAFFPVTIGFAELANYFGYCMPHLKGNLKPQWLAVILPVVFLSLQHCSLPLVFDTKFIFFRGVMYLPFALMLGCALYRRPALLPLLALLHGFMDGLAVLMLLAEIH